MNLLLVREKLKQFYLEDSHYGDISSAIFNHDEQGALYVKAKSNGVFTGELILKEAFKLVDNESKICLNVRDGEEIKVGDTIAEVKGNLRAILSMERIALNLIQRMSGIATKTNRIVRQISHTEAKLTDTRKTTPGLGMFEKYAVRVGGGVNHRRNLNDGLMLKDNHIAYSPSLKIAVELARAHLGPMDKIEVEIENSDMLQEAIDAKADIIMFDNCSADWIKSHISSVPKHIQTEASGNISEKNVRSYAESGVDFISMGALFYEAKALDISMKVVI
ncbi:carboxylating nicotinate-nucleotide diphosphorylase [Staphylococcus massiliensis]|uniref:Probable nicotinate-nucleotide pyrophosphorylase [carboxylating] n=1 Tax=Staphylococcus massiliensis S46 TaxID=1229783 RepID=K9AS09_9STAP|nr:carboxylating nicotinate-nucleotide diphosphorylase [Staphylococcus massiliensis]EKU50104.1 nicotinate-nucleotide pyrophosphorylase-like protein [Staphylococcus massiliensis S46]MCG3402191.1 carboxylating nicotinate-nucleotide diphosphorylase [Staphylococcus massiliensis]MCG3412841.1 carboxylating nicotinate-nucleotide diphosphorylase [Staphylococcus massiliensis]PNZ97460.1 nicotinate-nucleotide diphosphorylase (carboxylating) [Staphylococcus massiliensis CCUG 55927]